MARENSKLKVTKCNILSFSSKFFDPVGWISPIVAVARMDFQKACKKKCTWDEEVDEELKVSWQKYIQKLIEMKCIRIPRYLFIKFDGIVTSIELNGYCDSSESTCCAVIYANYVTNEGLSKDSRIVTSKSKIAPIKKTSIPRLELIACVLLGELMYKVTKVLKGTVDVVRTHYWSDSEVALAWIKGDEKRSPWVQNCIKKVKKLSIPDDWSYVCTSINPADIGTRETSALKIGSDQRWWYGPMLPHKGNKLSSNDLVLEDDPEVSKEKPVVTLSVFGDAPKIGLKNSIDAKRFSSLQKLLRVTVYIKRFVDVITKKEKRVDEITSEEKEKVLRMWIMSEQEEMSKQKNFSNLQKQLLLFSDQKGVFRLKGRLAKSHLPYDTKHPILLDKDSYFTKLIILDAHRKVKHMRVKSTLNEVRQRFWICSGTRSVRSAIRGCVSCKIVIGQTLIGPASPDLPEFRVTYEFAWSNIGIDYAGPLFVRDIYSTDPDMYKSYICIMTCAATRNVHVELVPVITCFNQMSQTFHW